MEAILQEKTHMNFRGGEIMRVPGLEIGVRQIFDDMLTGT